MALLPPGVETATIANIKRKHEGHFFDPGAMRFFRSRILEEAYKGPGGACFVTSEQFKPSVGPPAKRRYTVHRQTETGNIEAFGEFQAHRTSRTARRAAIVCARGKEG